MAVCCILKQQSQQVSGNQVGMLSYKVYSNTDRGLGTRLVSRVALKFCGFFWHVTAVALAHTCSGLQVLIMLFLALLLSPQTVLVGLPSDTCSRSCFC